MDTNGLSVIKNGVRTVTCECRMYAVQRDKVADWKYLSVRLFRSTITHRQEFTTGSQELSTLSRVC